jgi:hypothetical protein
VVELEVVGRWVGRLDVCFCIVVPSYWAL